MHISVPASTLAVVLAIIIILAILLRLIHLRHSARTGKVARAPRTPRVKESPRTPRAKGSSWRSPFPIRRGPIPIRRAPAGTSDHGLAVARKYGHERSPEWSRVAHEHLLTEPACVACGYKGRGLQVHHIKPFHLFPELELVQSNLITLCEIKGRDHHLLLGHLDDWESYNLNVHVDVKRFHKENSVQIRANPTWQKEEAQRPMPRP